MRCAIGRPARTGGRAGRAGGAEHPRTVAVRPTASREVVRGT